MDVIEAGFPAASPGDFEAVRRIAQETKGGIAVAALARCRDGDPQRAVEAIGVAERPHLHLFIATSDIHLKHKLRIDRDEARREAVRWVSWARETLGRDFPLVMGIALHPYIVGQPYRLRQLRRALTHIDAQRDRIWLARAGDIAAHAIALPPGTVP